MTRDYIALLERAISAIEKSNNNRTD